MNAADLRDEYDIVVVGAGPAGLAAATSCARAGLSTVLFDEQASPGGQIYRSITDTPVINESLLGPDYWKGARLAAAFAKSGAEYVSGATVWSLTPEREIGVSVRGGSRLLSARRVILATGALERPFPIPGWTLPGVMTVGAGQVLLKSSGLVPAVRRFSRDAGRCYGCWLRSTCAAAPSLMRCLTPRLPVIARLHFPTFLHSCSRRILRRDSLCCEA